MVDKCTKTMSNIFKIRHVCTKIIKVGLFLTELYKNNRRVAFYRHNVVIIMCTEHITTDT